MLKQLKIFFLLIIVALIVACTTTPKDPRDPYEELNRHTYKLNEGLDKAIFKPVAQAYKFILPKFATKAVSNFFSNLYQIPTIINDLLQAKFYYATQDTWRFGINSTLGVGGLIDLAEKMGLPERQQDFGLTLAQWGYKNSNYLVVPIIGPRTVRDAVAWCVDYCAFSVYPYLIPRNSYLSWGLIAGAFIDQRAQLLDFDETMKQAALDPYVFTRNAYLQRRDYLIKQSETDTEPKIYKNTEK